MTPEQIEIQLYALTRLESYHKAAANKIQREMLELVKQCPHPEDRLQFYCDNYSSCYVCEVCGQEFRKNPHKRK